MNHFYKPPACPIKVGRLAYARIFFISTLGGPLSVWLVTAEPKLVFSLRLARAPSFGAGESLDNSVHHYQGPVVRQRYRPLAFASPIGNFTLMHFAWPSYGRVC